MPSKDAISYAQIMAIIGSVCRLGEEFDVVDIRQLTDCEDDANAVNRAILQMAGYQDPVFEHVSRGRYRWLRYHSPIEKGSYNTAIPTKGVCPDCHMTLPAAGSCGYC